MESGVSFVKRVQSQQKNLYDLKRAVKGRETVQIIILELPQKQKIQRKLGSIHQKRRESN